MCWCEHAAAGVPQLATETVRRRAATAWPAERGLGDGLLGPALLVMGRRCSRRGATQWRANPGQLLDFRRFWSDELLAAYCEQRDEIRRPAPEVPVTTNLILPDYLVIDPWAWRREVDVVAVDHYLSATGPEAARRHRVRRRPGPVLRRRPPVAADGAVHPAGLRSRPDPQPGAGPDAPRQPRLRGPRLGQRAVLPVAGVPGRGGDVPLRRWCRTPGRTPRRSARSPRSARPCWRLGRGDRQHGHRACRAAVGRRFLVGAGQPGTARRGPALPGPGTRDHAALLAGRDRLRLGPPGGGPVRVPAVLGPAAVPDHRRGRRRAAPVRRGRRHAGRVVRQRAGRRPGQVSAGRISRARCATLSASGSRSSSRWRRARWCRCPQARGAPCCLARGARRGAS